MAYAHNLAINYNAPWSIPNDYRVEKYIGDLTFDDYRCAAERDFPFLMGLIDQKRITGRAFEEYVAFMNDVSWEFEDQDNGGRGVAYNLAQRASDNRKVGTVSLLKCFSDQEGELPSPDKIILDALGGDGTITRFAKQHVQRAPTIISADLSGFMVQACLAQKFPCIRQSATQSLLRDSVLDGVLIAYGSHHLNAESRREASTEAFRTIKTGGRFVLHDFEVGTPAADWFDKVVHPFSRTGHPHKHFTRDEMQGLLEGAGFSNVSVFSMSDPFVLKGCTPEEAHANAIMHLYRMYDLVRLSDDEAEVISRLGTYAHDILGKIQIKATDDGYTATIPREALVAVGTKAH